MTYNGLDEMLSGSFMDGVARAFDPFAGGLKMRDVVRHLGRAGMESDWEAVGRDMEVALVEIAEEAGKE